MLEVYTKVYDGETVWYAESTALVKALHERGWKCDAIQGKWAVAQPGNEDEEGMAYSLLCAAVPAVDADTVPDGEPLETFMYAPAEVGFWRMMVSQDLYEALWKLESA